MLLYERVPGYRDTLSLKTKQPTNETQTKNHKRLVDISTTLMDTHVCTHTPSILQKPRPNVKLLRKNIKHMTRVGRGLGRLRNEDHEFKDNLG